eukprot:2408111-Heterocapsa_arctica.AAC.1
MSGPSFNMIQEWVLIIESIKTDEPQPVNQCLGCEHVPVEAGITGKKDRSSLKYAATPFLDDDKVAEPIASRVLMEVLYAARLARLDLLKAVINYAKQVTQWDKG